MIPNFILLTSKGLITLIINYYILRTSYNRWIVDKVPRRESTADEFSYDVFISYRRNSNTDAVKLIRTALKSRGLRAFVDIEDLGSNFFDEQLIKVIENIENFILLISPGDLENCSNQNDWFRKEISKAITSKRNIIPILKDGFLWNQSSELPNDIKDLPRHNSIKYSTEYFDAMLTKVVSFFKDSSLSINSMG